MEGKLIRTDRNGTQYFASNVCRKCGGVGYLHGYEHIDGARCWKCGTTGREKPYTWKVYTPEYSAKLAAKRQAKALQQNIAKQPEFLASKGFVDGKIHVVAAHDTYHIREQIKAAGGHYDGLIGWYLSTPNESFQTVEMTVEECFSQDDSGNLCWKDDVCDVIKAKIKTESPARESEYIGQIGDKVQLTVTHIGSASFTTHFGYQTQTNYIHQFQTDEGDVVIWKTTSYFDHHDKIQIKGTIKDHSEYNGTKQTVLTRCKISA